LYGLSCKDNSVQPQDGPRKGRNMSLRESMYEHLSNKNIKQVVFDYILPIFCYAMFSSLAREQMLHAYKK